MRRFHRNPVSAVVASLPLLLLGFLPLGSAVATAQAADFSGKAALDFTAKAVAFGPRPSGSPANDKLRAWIRQQLATRGCEVTTDKFTAQTPVGPVPMENIIAKFPGKSGKAIAVTGHFDTKRLDKFVGANDGGSSTGFLLELAAAVQGRPRRDDLYLVFFDGEEAVREWTDTDSIYGSRHLAEKWTTDGTNRRLKALINVDMIGDKNFSVVWETNSAPSLRKFVWDTADAMGYAKYFPRDGGNIADDHMPFLNAGVRALDLIDFQSQGSFWHTPQDTMDKLSANSFQILGSLMMKVLDGLESQR
jgi:Zn-dependent M28 family amino/carboxypeptidase